MGRDVFVVNQAPIAQFCYPPRLRLSAFQDGPDHLPAEKYRSFFHRVRVLLVFQFPPQLVNHPILPPGIVFRPVQISRP
jgi:hypothetical protein